MYAFPMSISSAMAIVVSLVGAKRFDVMLNLYWPREDVQSTFAAFTLSFLTFFEESG